MPCGLADPRYHHADRKLDGWSYWTMGEWIPETAVIYREDLNPANRIPTT